MGSNITVRIQHNELVEIDCHRSDTNDLTLIPKTTIGSISTIRILQCSLQPIQGFLQRFGITQVETVLFDSGQLGGSLQRIHFKDIRGLQNLRLISNGFTALSDDSFADLNNITLLDLRSNKIELSRDIFATLENLNSIELDRNTLQDLPPGIFRNQRKLNYLSLRNNNLTSLNAKAFEGASSITDLDLSVNNIVTFRSDVFTLLTGLKNIYLDGNYFQSLPAGLFAENKNLSFFRLNNNRVPMKHLPARLLSDLPALKNVYLNCGLVTIPSDVFAKSSAIQNITISGNNLTELPNRLFVDQLDLIALDVSRNQLTTLPDDILQNTRNLAILRLSHNRLQKISRAIFASLTNLQFLYMDHNNLLRISPEAFTSNRNLIYINLQNNHLSLDESYDSPLKEWSSPFHRLMNLKVLNLRNNSILNMFDDWTLMSNLRILDLSLNNITTITVGGLQYLSRNIFVDLTNNTIRTIDFHEINYLNLNKGRQQINIALSHNPLNCDCELLFFVQFLNGKVGAQVKSTLKLSVDDLQCSSPDNLKGQFITQVSPKELICPLDDVMSSQKLCPSGCSCFVRPIDRILIVNCSNGGFTEIPSLPSLQSIFLNGTELFVQNNKIAKLPHSTTSGYEDVIKLHVANNSLTTIPVDNLPRNIDLLDVSYNKLQTLNVSTLRAFSEHRLNVALSQNPWLCDCTSQNLVLFVQANYKSILDLNDVLCVSGEKIQTLSPASICPIRHGFVIAFSVLISAIGLVLGILAALFYKYQREIKVWLYAHNMCLWFVTEEELDKDKRYDAFVSYSHKDEDFILDYLIPELESGGRAFKICFYIRDFLVGDTILNQIVRCVTDSRRTIIILSENFIESMWARMEFKAAHTAALNEGRSRIIVIIYGDIGKIDDLDPELKSYLQMNTYIKWGDPWFWDKLRYAMPHPSNNRSAHLSNSNVPAERINLRLNVSSAR